MTENELRRRFVMAVDEVLPAAPALEARVNDVLRQERRGRTSPPSTRARIGLGRGPQLAAGLAALLIAIGVVTALLFTAGMHHTSVPSRPAPLPTYKFTPAATTRLATWPEGGPVPADLAGCWRSQNYPNDPAREVCLGEYSFDVGQGASLGNVVVNGAEIYFFNSLCGSNVREPYDGYRYTVTGTTLVLINRSKLIARGTGPADSWSNCGWRLDDTYSKVGGT